MSKARDLASGAPAPAGVTSTEIGYVDGVTSAIQTQINARVPASTITTKGDLIVGTGSGTYVRQGVGSNGQVLTADSAEADGIKWATPAGGQPQEVVFTSSNASYTIPTGVTGFWALVVGGGGGGGSTPATANRSSGAGGAGRVFETFFTVSGDTTLNITVGAGGLGATTADTNGANGGSSTIVGNTSSTTYVTSIGGGGGGGSSNNGSTGASGGGRGWAGDTVQRTAGGGGAGTSATTNNPWSAGAGAIGFGGGGAPTTPVITGYYGGDNDFKFGGLGVFTWGRALGGGGNGVAITAFNTAYGAAASVAINTTGGNATANTGSGGGAAFTSTATVRAGGNGGSGLVVLRYVG